MDTPDTTAAPDPDDVQPNVNVPDNVDTSDPAAPASAPVTTAGGPATPETTTAPAPPATATDLVQAPTATPATPAATVPAQTQADTAEPDTPSARELDFGSLNVDQVDALLRDPNAPGDVRVFVATLYNVDRYLQTVEFQSDADGVTHVRPREV